MKRRHFRDTKRRHFRDTVYFYGWRWWRREDGRVMARWLNAGLIWWFYT